MRKLLPFLLLTACSSGAAPTTPPPPPAGTPTAASLSTAAGDGQTGAPGTALPVHPAVLVKDASGDPVSGVTVAFVIDSGGGSLSAGTAVSGTNGVATAGVWTLGTVAGRNTIKVTSGSLAPVIIGATASAGAGTIAPITLGTGDGTYTVSDPGPLHGLTLTVASGAFSSPTQATLSYAPATSFPSIPGVTPISPMITMSTSAGLYASVPLTIHVPVTVPANSFAVTVMFDPVSGAREVLPTLTSDANGVTSAFCSLSSGNLLGAAGARSLHTRLMASETTIFVTVALTEAALMADFDTGFRPGADDWEFPGVGTTATQVDTSVHVPMVIPLAALWYFSAHPSSVKLFNRFQLAAGVKASNRLGLRWVSELGRAYSGTVTRAVQTIFLGRVDGNAAEADYRQFRTVRAAFALAQGAPQPQLIYLSSTSGPGADLSHPPLIVYKAIGGTFSVADAIFPGDVNRTLTFTQAGGMQSYGTGASAEVAPVSMGITSAIPLATLSATYAKVVDGTIGDGDFFSYQFHSKYGTLGDTVWVADSLRAWMECPQCSPRITFAQAPEATASLTGLDVYTLTKTNSAWTLLGSSKAMNISFSKTDPATTTQEAATVSWLVPDAQGATDTYWLDWHPFKIVHLRDTISTTPLPTGAGVPSTLTQLPTGGPLPTHVTYTWDFGDNSTKASIGDNASVQHTFAAPGVYLVTAQMLDARTTQPIANTTLLDTVKAQQFNWRFTSAAAPVVVLPAGGIGTTHADTVARDSVTAILGRLTATPGDSRLFVIDSLGCRGIYLEQFPPGQANDVAYVPSAERLILGLDPKPSCADPLFNSTFSMGTLGAGALTGTFLPNGTPGFVTIAGATINATMSGTSISGTFVWRVNFTNGVGTYTVAFQGVQVLPKP